MMMNNKINKLLLLAVGITLFSCETYDFDQEQYKKEINLLQNSDGVYDRQCVAMEAETSANGASINLVVGVSGSQLLSESVPVSIVPSDSLFKVFNKSNYDIDSTRFAKLLPKECYEEPALNGVIKAGESQVKFPIKLKNLDKLSPDSIYFLDYKLDPKSTTPFNKKKKEVLLRIHWKNEFASTKTQITYNYNSTYVVNLSSSETARPTNTLRAFPLTVNSVRMLAGNEDYGDYKKAAPQIKQKSVVFTVGKQLQTDPKKREVVVTPYNANEMEVVMLTPIGEYDNTFYLNELVALGGGNSTYYKEFRVHYKYRLLNPQKDGTNKPGPFKEVKAKLRHQYNPRAEQL